MTLTSGLRKLALTAHVTSSVGWAGAVAAFLALAFAALTSQDSQTGRAADLAMNVTAWFVVVPLCVASVVTGVISSLGTSWGLFRHYWVLVKLLITIAATLVLVLHMKPISRLAREAAGQTSVLSAVDLYETRNMLAIAAAAGLIALLVATALSVYKPKGMTRYGWRKQQEQRAERPS